MAATTRVHEVHLSHKIGASWKNPSDNSDDASIEFVPQSWSDKRGFGVEGSYNASGTTRKDATSRKHKQHWLTRLPNDTAKTH